MSERLWKFSRSHDQCYIDCPRKAYLTYYYGGTGIVRKGLDIYMETGSLTHAMLNGVLLFAKATGSVPGDAEMDEICSGAIGEYKKSILEKGFDEFSGELELEMTRQAALAEGLTRAWTLIRLPYFLENYEIVSVEEEHEVPFGEGQVLLSRLDGVLKRKSDGELFVGPEFKTTGWMSDDYIESFRYSTQTLSQGLDVLHTQGQLPAGVMMEFLYKGMKKKDTNGEYVYYSPLVRAYRMVDEFGGETYGFDSSLGRKKDWKPFDTFTMGMGNWIPQIPLEILQNILFNTTVYRSEKELDEWKLQCRIRQAFIQHGIVKLSEEHPTLEAADELMATYFPARLDQFCYSNQYKKKCPYLDICYHSIDDPIGSGQYVERTPHHEGEFSDE